MGGCLDQSYKSFRPIIVFRRFFTFDLVRKTAANHGTSVNHIGDGFAN